MKKETSSKSIGVYIDNSEVTTSAADAICRVITVTKGQAEDVITTALFILKEMTEVSHPTEISNCHFKIADSDKKE